MTDSDIETLATRFFTAVEAGDVDTILSMYSPEVRVWHARDEADTDLAQSRELLALFFDRVKERRYEIVSRHVFDGGFVQEHITHGTLADGSKMRLPVCFLCQLDDQGLILRIAEYFDATKSPLRDVVQHTSPPRSA